MNAPNQRPIGIFDSGVGGLTVAASVRKALPSENIIYFGDTARVPYGNKSRSTVTRFSGQISDFLVEKNVKAIVIACNTASSFSQSYLRRNYDLPVIGVIKPGVEKAVSLSKNGRIGVIGTEAMVSSRAYEKELFKISSKHKLFQESCPLFVPLVENRMTSGEITSKIAEKYLRPLKRRGIDTLILGCTHYPMLRPVLSEILEGVKMVDSSEAVAEALRKVLEERHLLACGKRRKNRTVCYVSDDPLKFGKISGMFLKCPVSVRKVVLA